MLKHNSLFAQVQLLYPKPGYVEIDPDWLWATIIRVMRQCFHGKTVIHVSSSIFKDGNIHSQFAYIFELEKKNCSIVHK